MLNADHRQLDHVRGRALDRRVDRVTLSGGADGVIGRPDVAHVAAAPGDRFDEAVLARKSDGAVHIITDAGKLPEVLIDDLAAFFAWDAKTLRQAERGNAVSDAVIDHLGFAPHFSGDIVQCDAKHLCGGRGMNVHVGCKRFEQPGFLAEFGNDAQLNL